MKSRSHNPIQSIRMHALPALLLVAIVVVNVYLFQQYVRPDSSSWHFSGANPSRSSALPENLVPPQEIKQLAHAADPSATITKIELTNKNNKLVYVVSLSSHSRLVFDAQNGAQLESDSAPAPSRTASLPATLTTKTDFTSAGAKALAQKPGGVITSIELNSTAGNPTYSVHFTDGSVVDVAAPEAPAAASQPATTPTEPSQPEPAEPVVPESPSEQTESSPAAPDTAPEEPAPSDGM